MLFAATLLLLLLLPNLRGPPKYASPCNMALAPPPPTLLMLQLGVWECMRLQRWKGRGCFVSARGGGGWKGTLGGAFSCREEKYGQVVVAFIVVAVHFLKVVG